MTTTARTEAAAEREAQVAAEPPADNIGTVRRHISYQAAGEVANKAFRFVTAALLARALSNHDFGLFNVGIAAAGVLYTVTTLGLPELGMREIAVHPGRARWLAGRVLASRVLSLAAIAAVGVPVAAVLWPGHTAFLLLTVLLALAMTLAPHWVARGMGNMRSVGLAAGASGVVALLGALLVAAFATSVEGALLAFAAAEGVWALICWLGTRDAKVPDFGLSGSGELVRRAWPLALSSIAFYAYYANIDTIILASSHTEAEAGYYGAAYRVFLTFGGVSILAAYSLLPILSRAEDRGDAGAGLDTLRRGLREMACYGVLIIGLAEAFGEPALGLLFGEEFESVGPTFVVLCVAIPWYCIGYPVGYSLIARDRNRGFLAGAGAAGILNIVLNLLLIPPLGAMGAGVSTLASFVVAAIIWLAWRRQLDRPTLTLLAAVTVACLGAIPALLVPEISVEIGLLTALVAAVVGVRLFLDRRPGEALGAA